MNGSVLDQICSSVGSGKVLLLLSGVTSLEQMWQARQGEIEIYRGRDKEIQINIEIYIFSERPS